MAWFADITDLGELKRAYYRLAQKYHPDHGGDLETMKRINTEYAEAVERLKRQHRSEAAADQTSGQASGFDWEAESAEEFIEIVTQLFRLKGLVIELCGRWLWISGDTFKHRAALAACGCRWASQKKVWYWYPSNEEPRKKHKPWEPERIRERYGSQILTEKKSAGHLAPV